MEGKNYINQMKEKLITVLTVVYNGETTIARTIESVLNQTYPNIEYIIIDGASTDGTIKVAKSYQERFNKQEGRIFNIISEPDQGMYDGLNKGAKLAHGVLVGQINADDFYEPDAVAAMVKLYDSTCFDVGWGSICIHRQEGSFIKHAKIGKLWTTSGWCHPGMFSRREVLLEFPYICESMYDDFDYITTVWQAGRKIITTDQVISNFCFGGVSTKKSLKAVKERINISYEIYRRHGLSRLYWFHRVGVELVKYLVG